MSDMQLALVLVAASLAGPALLLARSRTVLFGFTGFCYVNIASASLAGLLNTELYGLSDYWITPAHVQVFTYTALGLIAFCLGAAIAWRPLWSAAGRRGPPLAAPRPGWLTPSLPVLLTVMGLVATLLVPVMNGIPTVGTFWASYVQLLSLGLLLAIVGVLSSGRVWRLVICTGLFALGVLVSALTSGFIGAGGTFLIQVLLVLCFWRGVRPASLLLLAVGGLMLANLMVGWLNTRYLIREGHLEDLPPPQQLSVYLDEFGQSTRLLPRPAEVQEAVFERVDMTNILAAQVRHQPAQQPYVYGETIVVNSLVSFVPRALWPEKPLIAGGSAMVARFSGLTFNETTSIGLPYQFELYANGGPVAVAFGLLLVGWAVARLELALATASWPLSRVLPTLYVTSALANGAQSIVVVLNTILIGAISYYLLGKLLMARAARHGPGEAAPAAAPAQQPS